MVVPAWREPADDEHDADAAQESTDLVVHLDPGEAFGYGNHPTTAALATRLRRQPPHGASVLDLGSGSGLLAVLAVRSGAGTVTAVDVAPEARSATRSNIDVNGVACRAMVAGATVADAAGRAPFDLILANVPIGAHEETAGRLGRVLAPGGQIWATGVTATQVDRLIRAHRKPPAGLIPTESVELDDGWWLVVFGGQGASPAAPSIP